MPILCPGCEGAPAGGCDAIEARPTAIVADAPCARDMAVILQPLQGRVQGALVDFDQAGRVRLDVLADPPSMLWLPGQCLEDEEVERTTQGVRGGSHVVI